MSIIDQTAEPNIISRLYALTINAHNRVIVFPKQEKYMVGARLETALLDALESACLAAQERKGFKEKPILIALGKMDLAKLLLRMANELELINIAQYQRLGAEMVEITAMIGGWLRFSRTQ